MRGEGDGRSVCGGGGTWMFVLNGVGWGLRGEEGSGLWGL